MIDYHVAVRNSRSTTRPIVADDGESREILDTVLRSLEAAAIVTEGDRVVASNEAAAALRLVFDGRLTSGVLAQLAAESQRVGRRVVAEIELPWGETVRAVHAVAAPVLDSRRVVLLVTDVEESRRVEAVRRDFIANVSHELKTPVGAMLLLAEAIRDAQDDPAALTHFIDRLIHEANRLSRLVKELIDLSRLQGGDPLPELSEVRVSDIVSDAVEPLHVRAEAAGIRLEVAIPANLCVLGDRRQLATAVTNLVENAIVYSSRGGRVGVGARERVTPEGRIVEIAVSDNGIGIARADQERIFERFYRVDPGRSRATGGTGLGLAIVKHIVNNHGGRISVWSKPGTGSTFTLHLPAPASDTTSSVTDLVTRPDSPQPRAARDDR